MTWPDLWLRLRSLFRRRHVERELDDELSFHLQMEARKHLAAGVSHEEARRRALRAFGGVAQAAEACRDQRRLNLLDSLMQDLRYALRTFGRNPYFALTAVLTLCIGIGANSTIFSAVNSTLVRSLPYSDPEGLVRVFESLPKAAPGYVKPADFVDWRTRARSIEGFAAFNDDPVSFSGKGEASRLAMGAVSPNFFRLLRIEPALGRAFQDAEEEIGKERVVMLSNAFWKDRFAGDRSVLGSMLTLDGSSYTVIGVLPAGFQFAETGAPEVWVPFTLPPGIRNDRYGNWLQVIARIRSGVTMTQAQSEMQAIADAGAE